MTTETHAFKTEVRRLLDLVIHSLYSKKEIFLRELISNASDALDRARFESLTDKEHQKAEEDWKVRIRIDKEARTLVVSDNGVGMNRQEIEDNIGTIANSGTKRFLDSLSAHPENASKPELIGQFGVGFYASFMVADKVEVITRRLGSLDPALKWSSHGEDAYTLEETDRAEAGTDVILHLREGLDEYLDGWRIRSIVKQYSDYIAYPVVLETPKPDVDTEDDSSADEGEAPKEEVINSRKAIWKKSPSEVSEEAYKEFYHHVSHDFGEPGKTIHYAGEGVTEFKALLFIPKQAPMDLYMREGHHGIHLYVRNVFITDDCKALLPEYLRFIKGVVDSSDLPLNVSREMLQDDAIIRKIRKNLVAKVLKTLSEMKEKHVEDYRAFFKAFGPVLKEGLHADIENKDKLLDLMLYPSTRTEGDDWVSFRDYVDRMPAAQKEIYVLTADSVQAAKASPLLEVFKTHDYEVLFWVDPIDEWVGSAVTTYGEKTIRHIDRGELDLDKDPAEEKSEEKKQEDKEPASPLLDWMKTMLSGEVKDVRFSHRLVDSPCCLVADEHGMNATMERVMKAMGQEVPESKRILEVNPNHPVVAVMQSLHSENAENPELKDYADLLLGQALLMEGSPLKDPARFSRLVSSLMAARSSERS
ncbi:MAG: molecular chaperone HtpG [Kiritimatiellae bacterium]|nr:molecular chaperone HtpG [Kiritimatiellia bacterium]